MLSIPRLIDNASVYRLVKLWTQRYVPDFSALSQQESRLSIADLIEFNSPAGRAKTVTHLKRFIPINCDCAAIKTDILFSYIPNVVNLTESKRLAEFVAQVYEKTLEIYQTQPSLYPALTFHPSFFADHDNISSNSFQQLATPVLGISEVEQLVMALEPVLQPFHDQHLLVKDQRAIGFMTTQFHFSTQLVLSRLTLPEQVLISPYFKFIEEQVCMPWQRVCNAAAKHHLSSPSFALVQQLLPASYDIALSVYRQAIHLYPNSRSLRGQLAEPGIMASTIRDLQMFQSYLWLCVLEGHMASVEKALLPLCQMVFPSVDVTWNLVKQVLQLLVDELMARVDSDQKRILLPSTQAMQQLFSEQ